MIKNYYFLVLILVCVEAAALYISSRPRFKRYFNFLPPVFWIYFIPMLLASSGIIDASSPIYQKISISVLPASLILLLLSSDIKGIMRLGRPALMMMISGSIGIMIGMPLVFSIFKHWVGPQMWSGFGALSASWIGGSANMIAVKEAIGTPDAVFMPMVIVDTVVPYVWMGILVALVGLGPLFDKWNKADRSIVEDLGVRVSGNKTEASFTRAATRAAPTMVAFKMVCMAIFAFIFGWIAQVIAGRLPEIKNMISTYAWTIIVVTLLGGLLSFTKARHFEKHGASKAGYFLLYFVLTSIGARANIAHIDQAALLILAGFLVVIFHAFIMLLVARIIRAPLFLVATASQANVGGVASAPVVAAVYEPHLASVGLLLAVFGNIVGTYLGIITAQICYAVGH